MINFQSFTGIITSIEDFWTGSNENSGCYKLITLENLDGNIINFIISPTTYFVNHIIIQEQDLITGYYDGDAPVPLIYPPRFSALIIAPVNQYENIKVDFFYEDLVSKDNSLKLNISPSTRVILQNNQLFSGNLGNRDLIVIYGPSTRSIPAITTPRKIIVLC